MSEEVQGSGDRERSRSRSPVRDRDEGPSKDDTENNGTTDNNNSGGGRNDHSGGGENQKSSSKRGGKSESRDKYRSSYRLYVANLPFELKWQDVKDLFREKVGTASYVELFEDLDGKPRGCGIIEFKDAALVEKAIEILDRYEIMGRRLVVKEDSGHDRDRTGRIVKGSSQDKSKDRDNKKQSGRGGDSRGSFRGRERSRSPPNEQWENTYGLSPLFLDSLNITGPISNRVFVANLDLKVTESKLYEVFQLAGHVVSAKLIVDKDGRSKGCAVVEYDHPVEAVQAISMLNRQVLYDRFMAVRMDRYENDKDQKSKKSTKLPGGLKGLGMGLGIEGRPLNVSSGGSGSSLFGAGMGIDGPMGVSSRMFGNDGNFSGGGMMSRPSGGMMRFEDDLLRSSMMRNDDMMMRNEMEMCMMRNLEERTNLLRSSMEERSMMRSGGMEDRNMMGMGGGMGYGDDMGMRGRDRIIGGANDRVGGSSERMGGSSDRMGNMGMSGGGIGMISGGDRGMGMNSNLDLNSMFQGGMGSGMNSGGGSGIGINAGFSMGNNNSGREISDFVRPNMQSSKDSDFRMDRSSSESLYSRRTENSNNIVTVRNLPSSNTWQSLLDKFIDVGPVEYAEIISRGVGRVRFASEQNAKRAANLFNRVYIDGQMIEVTLD